MRGAPELGLRAMLRELSTRPVNDVLAALRDGDRTTLLGLSSRMRSGSGFINDLRGTPDVTSEIVQPTLIIASRTDGQVPFVHAESLAASIEHAELVASEAESHFVWFGRDYAVIADKIRRFLTSDTSQ